MFIALQKKLLWMILFWFAILQTISPFIHAHVEADYPAQGHGLHLHSEGLFQAALDQHVISAHSTHTIGVNDAVVEDVDPLPLSVFTILFFISLAIVIVSKASFNLTHPPFPQFYLRFYFKPRAPPQF